MKKLLVVLLSMFLLISLGGCNSSDTNNKQEDHSEDMVEGKYPIKWDDVAMYEDDFAIESDLRQLKAWAIELQSFKGKLDTVDGLYGYFSSLYSFNWNKILSKLEAYASFGMNVYPMEDRYIYIQDALSDAQNELGNASSFIGEEMANIPYEKRVEIINDEKMSKYKVLCSEYLKEDYPTIDSDKNSFNSGFSYGSATYGNAAKIYKNFINYEIPEFEVKLKNGKTVTINNNNISSYMYGDYDTESKFAIYEAYWKNVSQFKNTLSSLIEQTLFEQYYTAALKEYNGAKERVLKDIDLKEDIIQMIIDYAHAYADANIEYQMLYSEDGEKYYTFSNTKSLSSYDPGYIKYDDGVDDVINAMSVFGNEYVEAFKEIITSGHVDVYPADYKTPGAFELGNFTGQNPFIMFNYEGKASDVADIAHEMGHAIYSKLTNENVDSFYWNIPVFNQEVASITAEMTYYSYKIATAKTDEERIFHIENYLSRWANNVFSGCMRQEFEDYCHNIVEYGDHLSPDDLCAAWQELNDIYYGSNRDLGEYGNYGWSTASSTINNYYEFTYASSMCYATILSQRLINNEPGALDAYMSFLKAGTSVKADEALALAGIDVYSSTVYDEAFNYFIELVNELKTLKNK